MIKLTDLISLTGMVLDNFKIHCAVDNKNNNFRPLKQFYDGTFNEGQSEQNKKNFECKQVLALINLHNSERWLFAGVYNVNGCSPLEETDWSGFRYDLILDPRVEHLVGRVIVDFTKTFRASYLVGSRWENELLVAEILREKLAVEEFPGYKSVRIEHDTLTTIVRQGHSNWRTALRHVAGIYLIMDTYTGYQYIGSASGQNGIWQRWSDYAENGHGGNKELKKLIRDNGITYASNFQYSILETIDLNGDEDYIRQRESFWQETLMTREFGLN